MTLEQQRIAISEACGWEPLPEGHFHPDNPIGQTMPNYLNDLNAANAEIEEKRKDIVYLATEKAKLEERIKRLEEDGDEAICPIEYATRVRIWTKAKEAKL